MVVRLSHRCLLIVTALAASIGFLCGQPSAVSAAEPSRPNIVFILADDWGWGDLDCHGNKLVNTPHLDRLAREGTDF